MFKYNLSISEIEDFYSHKTHEDLLKFPENQNMVYWRVSLMPVFLSLLELEYFK